MGGARKSILSTLRSVSEAAEASELARLGPKKAFRDWSRGQAFYRSVRGLSPSLSLCVSRVPKALRKLAGSKFSIVPLHVDPRVRYRALLKAFSVSSEASPSRCLVKRLEWAISDLAQPGLKSALFSKKISVYQEVVRRLKREL